jgi:hypothetical protein
LFSLFFFPIMTIFPAFAATRVPLSRQHHATARQFAQANPTQADQVYRQTLAVLALQDCLEFVDIPTDFAGSDWANPVLQLMMGQADLRLPGLGRLDCCLIQPGEAVCPMPDNCPEDRLGVVVVELAAPYQTAEILGFSAQTHVATIARATLQPLEDLFLQLDSLLAEAVFSPSPNSAPSPLRLSQWLTAAGQAAIPRTQAGLAGLWQTLTAPPITPAWGAGLRGLPPDPGQLAAQLESLVGQLYQRQGLTPPPGSAQAALLDLVQTCTDAETRWKAAELLWAIAPQDPRSGVRRRLDLGLFFLGQPLTLMVAVLPPAAHSREFDVLARVTPVIENPSETAVLPLGLTLAIVPTDGSSGLQTQARERDNCMQIKLQAQQGETFRLELRLEDNVITEYFEV